jgi:hypothetical protein
MTAGFEPDKDAPQLVQVSALPGLTVPQFEQARGFVFSGWLVRRSGWITSPQPGHHRQPPGLFIPHFVQQTFGKARPFYLKTKGNLFRTPWLSHIIVIYSKQIPQTGSYRAQRRPDQNTPDYAQYRVILKPLAYRTQAGKGGEGNLAYQYNQGPNYQQAWFNCANPQSP